MIKCLVKGHVPSGFNDSGPFEELVYILTNLRMTPDQIMVSIGQYNCGTEGTITSIKVINMDNHDTMPRNIYGAVVMDPAGNWIPPEQRTVLGVPCNFTKLARKHIFNQLNCSFFMEVTHGR